MNFDNGYVNPLPMWEDGYDSKELAFNTGMQYNAPFFVTQDLARSDLGFCIISTRPPHIVCRVHSFRTGMEAKMENNQSGYKTVAQKEEDERREYLEMRAQAFENLHEARRKKMTVREVMEARKMVYDEEFDEARCVMKVPGLNVYLELVGCLDDMPKSHLKWEGRFGILETLDYMCAWAQNIWRLRDRKNFASREEDWQPLKCWQESYNAELRPWMPAKRGLGHTFADPSRRPEMLLVKYNTDDKEYFYSVRQAKMRAAYWASQGVAPKDYGE